MRKLLWILIAIPLLLYIPFTRRLIVFILPLGRGIDDLLFFISLGVLAVYLIWRVVDGRRTERRRAVERRRTERDRNIERLERELDVSHDDNPSVRKD